MKYIFNPEHDLCLANGNASFVPPASALKFGSDCHDILETVFGQPENCTESGSIVPWGWNSVLKYSLLKSGTPEALLPSDEVLDQIRKLSHRRTAIMAGQYTRKRLKESGLDDCLIKDTPEEIRHPDDVNGFLEKHPSAVFKAPWSGSGKGLRWIRSNEFSHSDRGWCRNVIAKQGSVIAEKREDVVCDFAMLFQSTATGIIFEGYSLFDTDNGAYRSNILASDRYILAHLLRFIPENVLTAVRRHLAAFLEENFLGRYEGYLGADMFICRTNTDSQGKYMLNPCVEINVRMTMGLLARKYFDLHMTHDSIPEYPYKYNNTGYGTKEAVSGNEKAGIDGRYRFSVIYAPDHASLRQQLAPAVRILTGIPESALYSIAVFASQPNPSWPTAVSHR